MSEMQGWSAVPNWVVRDAEMDAFEKLVYIALLNRAGADGYSWPSIRTLSRDAGCAERTVRDRLRSLEERGLVRTEHREDGSGGQISNRYFVGVYPSERDAEAVGKRCRGGRQEAQRGAAGDADKEYTLEKDTMKEVVAPQSGATATLLPDDFRPSQSHVDKAASLHLDVQREFERFRAHAVRNRRRQKNWNAAFTNWLRKGAEYAQQRSTVSTPARARVDQNLAEYQRLYGEIGGGDAGARGIPAAHTGIGA